MHVFAARLLMLHQSLTNLVSKINTLKPIFRKSVRHERVSRSHGNWNALGEAEKPLAARHTGSQQPAPVKSWQMLS